MAACNPFNVMSNEAQQDDELVCKFEDTANRAIRLSHRVNPLKHSLLNIIWDFGALTKEHETKYIQKIIKIGGDKKYKKAFCNAVAEAHFYVKNEVEKNNSSVSLRDIERVNNIFHFCLRLLTQMKCKENTEKADLLEQWKEHGFTENEDNQAFLEDLFFQSLSLTMTLNYLFRLYKKGNKHSQTFSQLTLLIYKNI